MQGAIFVIALLVGKNKVCPYPLATGEGEYYFKVFEPEL